MNDNTLKQDNDPQTSPTPSKTAAAVCPICGKPSVPADEPFCSSRCANVDLNRWFTGAYAIPGKPVEDDDVD